MTGVQTCALPILELARQTEIPVLKADSLHELAGVLGMRGRYDEAREVIAEAIALYVAKGDIVSAARSRARAEAWP